MTIDPTKLFSPRRGRALAKAIRAFGEGATEGHDFVLVQVEGGWSAKPGPAYIDKVPAAATPEAGVPAEAEAPAEAPAVDFEFVEKKERRKSAVSRIRELLAEDPTMSIDAIEQRLASEDMPKSRTTIETIRSDFMQTYKALQAAGRIVKE